MSSEDEYYADRYEYRYDRRSSKRPRRRGSSPRRQREQDCYYFPRKSRRNKIIYNQYGPRLAGVIILFLLIVYEIIVLKKAVSSDRKSSAPSRTTRTTASSPVNNNAKFSVPSQARVSHPTAVQINAEPHQTPPAPSKPISSATVSSADGSKSATSSPQQNESRVSALERVTAAAGIGADVESNSSYENAKTLKTADSADVRHTSKTMTHHLPESAIKMETKGADEDPDIEPGNVRKIRSSHTAAGPSTLASANGQGRESKAIRSGDGGAEPGAGENFWNWFQENKGSEKETVSKSISCPEENKRLCEMFYKYIRKYKIRSIFDVSCEKNLEWMGGILKKSGNELWGFKYYCSLWSGERAEDARRKLGGLPFVEFDEAKWWRAGFAPDTELLFAWDTLAHLAYGRVWNFFVKARKQDIKYVLVDNYPGILNDPSPKRDYLNLRKHPFRFPSAKEVAQNVTEPGENAKRQLLFYETSMLPDNLQ